MKTFDQIFVSARAVSTPLVTVQTVDATATVKRIRGLVPDADVIAWDAVTGLQGLNDGGKAELISIMSKLQIEQGATPSLALSLGVLAYAKERDSELIVFLHNTQLQLKDSDATILQGILNLRDLFKASGSMLVLFIGGGDSLPVELQNDVLLIDEPLPSRDELAGIVKGTTKCAGVTLADDVIKAAVDALIGLPAFPCEQAVAMELDKETKVLDIEALWGRKRSIVGQMAGLTFHQGKETLTDMYGVESIKTFGNLLMTCEDGPNLIMRVDEIEKQIAGSSTDSSGTKGDILGELLTWLNDNEVIASLFLGVSGSSKSWAAYCLGGEYRKPVLNYSLTGLQNKHVGESSSNQRAAQRCAEAIAGGGKKIWLIATANSLDGMPPELLNRFSVGGIWFFDTPSSEEVAGIMKLKIRKYGLDASQPLPDLTGWTGRDCENAARKAALLNISLTDASKYVIPLARSHAEQIRSLRQSAHDKYLSASHDGVYKYTEPSKADAAAAGEGRRIR